jgi:hypothetical protein
VEGDALDDACQRFLDRRCGGWLHAEYFATTPPFWIAFLVDIVEHL